MSIPKSLENLVSMDPEVIGGEPCFTGTRVPLATVVDNLAGGHSVQDILDNFRTLSREHVTAVLRWERELAIEAAGLEIRAS